MHLPWKRSRFLPEALFRSLDVYKRQADDIRKGPEKKLDAMVNREVYSKSKTAPTKEELKN